MIIKTHGNKSRFFCQIPNILSLYRISVIIPIIQTFQKGKPVITYCLFLTAVFTDFLDGFIARKYSLESTLGAQVDSFSDFFLIISLLIFFNSKEIIPFAPIIFLFISFIQFMISTITFRFHAYDPIGKYTGSFCFILILIILLLPSPQTGKICAWIISISITISLGFRFLYFRDYFLKSLNNH